MVSAAALINNSCGIECLVVQFQDKALKTGGWGTICESKWESTQ